MEEPSLGPDDQNRPADSAIWSAVAWNALLFGAGRLLTSGGFLSYFAAEFDPSPFWLTVLLIVPESAGIAALLARPLILSSGSAKRVWLQHILISRALLMGLPVIAWCGPTWSPQSAFTGLVVLLILASAELAISYAAFICWLADLIPAEKWKQLFALRQVVDLLLLLGLAAPLGYGQQYLRKYYPGTEGIWLYALIFIAGLVLQLLSLWPLLRLPDDDSVVERLRQEQAADRGRNGLRQFLPGMAAAFRDRRFRRWVFANWWLAAFSGLTQSAFFLYRKNELRIGLGTYHSLEALMRATQLPLTALTVSRWFAHRELAAFRLGVVLTSGALIFWLAARPESWWLLIGASLCFGGWAPINVVGPKRTLSLSPPHDHAAHWTLFHNGSGLLAGLSGLFGGWLLDVIPGSAFGRLLQANGWDAIRFLFACSLAGRLATLLVLPRESD